MKKVIIAMIDDWKAYMDLQQYYVQQEDEEEQKYFIDD